QYGNLLIETVNQNVTFGVLRAGTQAIVQTNLLQNQGNGIGASSFANSRVGFTDTVTIRSPSLPVGTVVQFNLPVDLSGFLGASGATQQTSPNVYSVATVRVSLTLQGFTNELLVPFNPFQPTSAQGTATPNSMTLPISFIETWISRVGDSFVITGELDNT